MYIDFSIWKFDEHIFVPHNYTGVIVALIIWWLDL